MAERLRVRVLGGLSALALGLGSVGFGMVLTAEPASAQTVTFTSSQVGTSGQTAQFGELNHWQMAWSYDCANFGASGNFIVNVNQPSNDLTVDVGPNELGMSGSGTDHYTDTGIFSLSVTSECTWTVTVSADATTPSSGTATFSSTQVGGSGQTAQFSEQGAWKMAWTYTCANTGSSGNFIVDINQPPNDLAFDQGPNELGMSGSGTDHYTDTGIFSLSIISGCEWTIAVSPESATTPPPQPPPVSLPPGTTRLAGNDRYGTAAAVGEAQFSGGVPSHTAILAVGRNFNLVDALAVAPLAKAMNVPVLLAESPTVVGPTTVSALSSLGVSKVVLVGAAQNLVGHLPAGIAVSQVVAGSDRYATAAAIASALEKVEGVSSFPSVVISSGEAGHLVDSISVGSAAASIGAPILLAPVSYAHTTVALPSVEAPYVAGAKTIYTVGVVGSSTVTGLPAGATVMAVYGTDRYDTSAAVDGRFFPSATTALVGNGTTQNMVDSLAAGGFGGAIGAPVVLTDSGTLSASVSAYLHTLSAADTLTVLGGSLSIPNSAVVTIKAALG